MIKRHTKSILVLIFIFMFIGTSFLPAFNCLEIYDIVNNKTVESIRGQKSIISGYSEIDLSSDKLPEQYKKLKNLIPLRQADTIDGEEWDIVVPDDYTMIQEAIDHAGLLNGYRIFVRAGHYLENIVIETDGITLHGENKQDTSINGDSNNDVISIDCNYLNISGFTIRNSGNDQAGIKIHEASGNLIEDNILTDNSIGVAVINHSHANNITGNEIKNNNIHGILLSEICTGNTVYDNSISDNIECGIAIYNISRGNIITWNNINGNLFGVNCTGFSNGNIFYANNFNNNNLNAYDSSEDSWDNGDIGNYWDDYIGVDSDGDGIGDTPHLISGGANRDNCPLMDFPLEEIMLSLEINEKIGSQIFNEDDVPSDSVIPGDTIIVPDNYATIQEAVDHSNDGDNIFVRSGIYHENVIVDKQIKIEGEDKENTIIDGGSPIINITVECEDQSQSNGNLGWGCWGNAMFAQSFVPTIASLTKIKLKLSRKGNPEGLFISIREKLNGKDLTSCYMSVNRIDNNKGWIEFDLPDINLTPGETYYIIWDPDGQNINNVAYWNLEKNNPYDKGSGWFFNYNQWNVFETDDAPDLDFCFETYGNLTHSKPKDEHIFYVLEDYIEILNFSMVSSGVGYSGIRLKGNHANIHNNIISFCGDGIALWSNTDSMVNNNTVTHCIWGVYIHQSFEFNINGNTLLKNMYGIQAGKSTGNFSQNLIINNYFQGALCIYVEDSFFQKNNFSYNTNIGIQMFSCIGNTFFLNNIIKNANTGFSLHKSCNNIFDTNTLKNTFKINPIAFEIYDIITYFNNIINLGINMFSRNIELYYYSNNNNFSRNKITTADICICSTDSENISFYNNYFNNSMEGFMIENCNKFNFLSNYMKANFINCLAESSNAIIKNNYMGTSALAVYWVNDYLISKNQISSPIGLYILGSNNGTINNNNFYNIYVAEGKGSCGIWVLNKVNNITISNCIFSDNYAGIMFLNCLNSKKIHVKNNEFSNNTKGIILGFSNLIEITENNFHNSEKHHAIFFGISSNKWDKNYWDDWNGRGPKWIFGYFGVDFDWHPAQESYDIG